MEGSLWKYFFSARLSAPGSIGSFQSIWDLASKKSLHSSKRFPCHHDGIIKANLAVIRIVLSPKLEIEPVLVKFTTDLRSETAQVVLGNSITLTPGTYTAGLENGEFVVQALDKSFAEGLNDSVFVKQLRKLEE